MLRRWHECVRDSVMNDQITTKETVKSIIKRGRTQFQLKLGYAGEQCRGNQGALRIAGSIILIPLLSVSEIMQGTCTIVLSLLIVHIRRTITLVIA